jgi:hypothetical protein
MEFLLCHGGIFMIDLVLSGSTEIPYLEITCPNKIPSETKQKIVFLVF